MNIVQIGTNKGGNDHAHGFIRENINNVKNCVFIDPLPKCIEEARKCYEYLQCNKTFLKACIVPDNRKEAIICLPEEDAFGGETSELASVLRANVEGHGVTKIKEMVCPAIEINHLLDMLHFDSIDALFIDTEGLDCHLIINLNLSKYKIKKIRFEISHSDGPHQKGRNLELAMEKLRNFGYTIENNDWDTEASLKNS